MSSTPCTGGKESEIPPAALTDVVNLANQNPFAKIFMAQEGHLRGGQRRGCRKGGVSGHTA